MNSQSFTQTTTHLTTAEREKIYHIFLNYERWLVRNSYFDSSDLVNHCLSQMRWYGYRGNPIHFMMCDEVQDLPPATLHLLLKITEQNIFFSGDTAQTIAQGVNFRFADLKKLFNQANMVSGLPFIKQLTINFRSHARILDLANSVIRVLEIFFPNTIDKLKKEKSDIDGLKPIILSSNLAESLFYLLMTEREVGKEQGGILARPALEFGCNQVIIVRNQDSKKNLPSFLKHALCLTIYEAKVISSNI